MQYDYAALESRIRVEKPGDLNETLKSALAMNKPVVVDVVTDTYAIAKKPWVPN